MRWFDASPRRATPKGHDLHHLHSTASGSSDLPHVSSPPRSWRTQDRDRQEDGHLDRCGAALVPAPPVGSGANRLRAAAHGKSGVVKRSLPRTTVTSTVGLKPGRGITLGTSAVTRTETVVAVSCSATE